MNKLKFMPLALAALMLGSCSNEDLLDKNDGGNGTGEGVTSYVAVNLMTPGATPGSRAPYEQGDGTYEDGTAAESEIKSVRFYVFNRDGSAYNLTGGTNYVDANPLPTMGNGSTTTTTEKIGSAVLVLNGQTTTNPYSIVAVANANTNTALGTTALSLSDLKGKIGTAFSTTENGFVMSNSVYAANGAEVCEVLVEDKIKTSSDAATSDPVDIYIERVLAKVTLNVNTGSDTKWITTGSKPKMVVGQTSAGADVYAVIDGWNLADANGKSNLLKKINTSWTDNSLGIAPWSTADYHRSFWATSVGFGASNAVVNQPYTAIINALGTTLYTQENTPTAAVSAPYNSSLTKVIVAAHLEDVNGNALEICKYKGYEYVGVADVKTQILSELSDYKKDDAGTSSLTTDDITFEKVANSYKVIAKLATGVTAYKNDNGTWTDATQEVNTTLAANPADVRTGGKVYYFAPIGHLGSAGSVAQYGVVRNHSYNVTIDNLTGFGTPVYDPTDKTTPIDPVIPSDQATYMAARINVLSWRVVNTNVDMNKGDNTPTTPDQGDSQD